MCISNLTAYTLSELTVWFDLRSNGEKNPRVKHYLIRQTDTGENTFYLAEKYLFSTIPELILYHQHNAAGNLRAFSLIKD